MQLYGSLQRRAKFDTLYAVFCKPLKKGTALQMQRRPLLQIISFSQICSYRAIALNSPRSPADWLRLPHRQICAM